MQCVRVAPQISPELANPASGNQAVGIIVTEGFAERLEVALNSVVGRARPGSNTLRAAKTLVATVVNLGVPSTIWRGTAPASRARPSRRLRSCRAIDSVLIFRGLARRL